MASEDGHLEYADTVAAWTALHGREPERLDSRDDVTALWGDCVAWMDAQGYHTCPGLSPRSVDLYQGDDEQGRPFGYVSGDGGGYFFTWHPTLDATLDSVEEDEVDGSGDLDEDQVVRLLRHYLPTTRRGRRLWGD